MTDEEIIRRKLMFDGDGTGDDRRLNVILKMLVKWVKTEYETIEDSQYMQDKILAQIISSNQSRMRSQTTRLRNNQQLVQYQQFQDAVKERIFEVRSTINTSKIILNDVKAWRQNKRMYHILAKGIKEYPTLKETEQEVAQLKMDISKLHEERIFLEHEFESNRKRFYVLATSANQIRNSLENINKTGK